MKNLGLKFKLKLFFSDELKELQAAIVDTVKGGETTVLKRIGMQFLFVVKIVALGGDMFIGWMKQHNWEKNFPQVWGNLC